MVITIGTYLFYEFQRNGVLNKVYIKKKKNAAKYVKIKIIITVIIKSYYQR